MDLIKAIRHFATAWESVNSFKSSEVEFLRSPHSMFTVKACLIKRELLYIAMDSLLRLLETKRRRFKKIEIGECKQKAEDEKVEL